MKAEDRENPGSALRRGVVLGSGISGFATAARLTELGWRVHILRPSPGATALSSGAWDFGKIPAANGPVSFAQACAETFVPNITSAWIDWDAIPQAANLEESTQWAISLLAADLPMEFSTSRPALLVSTQGSLRDVYVAQKPQMSGDLSSHGGGTIGVLSSPSWNYPAEKLCRSWEAHASRRGVQGRWRVIECPTLGTPDSLPLEAFSQSLLDPAKLSQWLDSTRPLIAGCDLVLIPPICPDYTTYEKVTQAWNVAVAEPLCSREPIAGQRLDIAIQKACKRLQIPVQPALDCRLTWEGTSARTVLWKQIPSPVFTGIARDQVLRADSFVFAGGRFLSGGFAHSGKAWDASCLGLCVGTEKTSRSSHAPTSGFEMERLGLSTDSRFRPLNAQGERTRNVHAVGSCIGETLHGIGVMTLLGRLCAEKV